MQVLEFRPVLNTNRAKEAIRIFKMDRSAASRIGLEANEAKSKSKAGPARSHPERVPSRMLVGDGI
jgi:hypothetical protein